MTRSASAAAWPRGAWVFLGGQAVSLLGDGLAVLALPLLVLELSRSPLVSGISAASVTIGYLCVGVPAGVIVDRGDPWRVLIMMDAVRAVVFLVLYAAAAAGVLTAASVVTLGLVAGAARVFFDTALTVVVQDLFPGDALIRANSIMDATTQTSMVVGPAAAGALALTVGMHATLLVNALSFLVSLASLAAMWHSAPRERQHTPALRFGDIGRDFRDGLRYLLSIRLLVLMTGLQMVVNFGLAVNKLLFYYAKDTLGLAGSAIGVVVAAGGAGGVVGALAAPQLAARVGRTRIIGAGIAVAGLAVAAMSVIHSVEALLVANVILVCAVVTASLVNRTQRQHLVRRDMLGRVTGTAKLLFLASDPLGVLIAGGCTTALSGNPRPVFLVGGMLVVVAAAYAWQAGLKAPDSHEI